MKTHEKWGYSPSDTYYSISKDLPCEEDLELVVKKVIDVMGPSGRMLLAGKNIGHNHFIFINGQKVWYGDVDYTKDQPKFGRLEALFGFDAISFGAIAFWCEK